MKKALISPTEIVYDSNDNECARVAGVADVEFPVAEPLYWVDCPDECVQDKWVYLNGELIELPEPHAELREPEIVIDTIIRI